MRELLEDLLEYMESRADADNEGPNKEMGFQIRIEEALAKIGKPETPEPQKMQYNVCGICGASDGRAGILFGGPDRVSACQNCEDTRKLGKFTVHTNLNRTVEELEKTLAILDKPTDLPAPNTVMWWLCRIADPEIRRKAVRDFDLFPMHEDYKTTSDTLSVKGAIDSIDWDNAVSFEFYQKLYLSEIPLLPAPDFTEYNELRK